MACFKKASTMTARGTMRRWALAITLAWAGVGAAGDLFAAPRPMHLAAADGKLAAEVAALRAELDRKTDEISALKRSEGVGRADADLRRRMAEANELAQRLTRLESELSQRGGAGPGRAPVPPVEAPAALAARADLLSDEAHKLQERAAGMLRAAGQLRARQNLRRRAAVVERDPFVGLDGSKRLMFVRGASTLSAPGAKSGGTRSGAPTTTAGGTSMESATSGNSGGAGSAPQPMPPSPMTGLAPPTAPTTSPVPTTAPAGNPPPASPTPVQDSAGGGPTSDKGATAPTAAPAPTMRPELAPGALLDPALRAQLSRADASALPVGTDPAALEQAAAALADRAKLLETQAKALRAQAASR
jgi:hypothetical protein